MGFEKVFKHTLKYEGGYVNNKNDKGGETYKGVSRKANPKWAGWLIIEKVKENLKLQNLDITARNMNRNLENISELEKEIKNLYKKNYWDVYEKLNLDMQIKTKLFDMGVNMGVGRALKMLQKSFNYLGAGLIVDGLVGQQTINASAELSVVNKEKIINSLVTLQKEHYRAFVKTQPYWAKYLSAFLQRADFKGVN